MDYHERYYQRSALVAVAAQFFVQPFHSHWAVRYLHPPLTYANFIFVSVVLLTDSPWEEEFAEPERQDSGTRGRVKQVCLSELGL